MLSIVLFTEVHRELVKGDGFTVGYDC
jgi:hypothetical protein